MIAFRLKELAEQKELNRHQVSMMTGVSYPTVHKYWLDTELTAYDKDILEKFCELLGCTPGDLIVRVEGTGK